MAALVDTNVLVCAHDRDTGDKHLRAVDLLAKLVRLRELTVSAQILNELGSVLLRKRRIARSVVARAIGMLRARRYGSQRVRIDSQLAKLLLSTFPRLLLGFPCLLLGFPRLLLGPESGL